MRHYRKIRGEEHTLSGDDCLQEKIPFGIDTKTDCVFYRLDERTFEILLEEDSRFLSYIMEAVTCNYVTLVRKFHDTQEECASKRLYKWFLAFSSREGQYRAVPHGFTYAEIAKYLGMHPVTVSKLSSALKKAGIIKKEKRPHPHHRRGPLKSSYITVIIQREGTYEILHRFKSCKL